MMMFIGTETLVTQLSEVEGYQRSRGVGWCRGAIRELVRVEGLSEVDGYQRSRGGKERQGRRHRSARTQRQQTLRDMRRGRTGKLSHKATRDGHTSGTHSVIGA